MRKHIQHFIHRFGKPVSDWYAEFRILLKRRQRLWTDFLSNISKVLLVTGIIGPLTGKMGIIAATFSMVAGILLFYLVLKYGHYDED